MSFKNKKYIIKHCNKRKIINTIYKNLGKITGEPCPFFRNKNSFIIVQY